jgi:hypothetical protein
MFPLSIHLLFIARVWVPGVSVIHCVVSFEWSIDALNVLTAASTPLRSPLASPDTSRPDMLCLTSQISVVCGIHSQSSFGSMDSDLTQTESVASDYHLPHLKPSGEKSLTYSHMRSMCVTLRREVENRVANSFLPITVAPSSASYQSSAQL